MTDYLLFNEKIGAFIGLYSSDKMLERGEIINFQGDNYLITNLMVPCNKKLRISVWPSVIHIPDDLEDSRLLHWIQQYLKGLKIRISDSKTSFEGKVTGYWSGIKMLPPLYIKTSQESVINCTDIYPKKMEILSIGSSNQTMIDLLDYKVMEILGT